MRSLVHLLSALAVGLTPVDAPSPERPWRERVERAFSATSADVPKHDRGLAAAAVGLAAAPPNADVRRMLRAGGVHDGLILPVVADGIDQPDVRAGLDRYLARHVLPQGVTHYGLARHGDRLAMVFTRRLLSVRTLPKPTAPGQVGRLEGILAGGYSAPTIVVARPDDRIDVVEADVTDRRLFANVPFFGGPGRYVCEVVATGARGREVLSLLHVDLGDVPPNLPTVRVSPAASGPSVSPGELVARLRAMINRDRKRLGLPSLRRDGRLQRTADAHARAMARTGIAAHVLPGGRDAGARLEQAGIVTSRFYENVAMASTLDQAHADLWASPTHRLALIDPLVTHVGIGIAVLDSPGGRVLYVTEHLAAR